MDGVGPCFLKSFCFLGEGVENVADHMGRSQEAWAFKRNAKVLAAQ